MDHKEYALIIAKFKEQDAKILLNYELPNCEHILNKVIWQEKMVCHLKNSIFLNQEFSKSYLLECFCYLMKKSSNRFVFDSFIKEEENKKQLRDYFVKKGVSEKDAICYALTLRFYTFYHGNEISNLEARPGKHINWGDNLTKEEEKCFPICKYTINALSYLPNYYGVCRRAVDLSIEEKNKYQIGSIIKWVQMSSCTINTDFPDYLNKRNTYFVVYTLRGKYIANFSTWPIEEEIVLLPNSFFVVCDIKKMKGRDEIYLRELIFDL